MAKQRSERRSRKSSRQVSCRQLGLEGFLKDVRSEMRKVVTPSRAEVQTTTIVVIVTVFIFRRIFGWWTTSSGGRRCAACI